MGSFWYFIIMQRIPGNIFLYTCCCFACLWVCECTLRPDDSFGWCCSRHSCMCAHTCVVQRLMCFPLFLRRESLTEPEAHWLSLPDWPATFRDPQVSPSQAWDYSSGLLGPAFRGCWLWVLAWWVAHALPSEPTSGPSFSFPFVWWTTAQAPPFQPSVHCTAPPWPHFPYWRLHKEGREWFWVFKVHVNIWNGALPYAPFPTFALI